MTKGKGGGRGRENVPRPTKGELNDASKLLRNGSPAGGRVMSQGKKGK